MKKLCTLILLGTCGAAAAQTPTPNLMPDGSHDMYVGLGAASTPIYDGAQARKARPLPVLQVQWSNGVFISGQSAGMHLSSQPGVEFGPLAALQPRRTDSGTGSTLGSIINPSDSSIAAIAPINGGVVPPPSKVSEPPPGTTRLTGLAEIGPRLELGGFVNFYLQPELRIANSLLAGAGNDHNGVHWNIDVQRILGDVAPHHWLALSAGMTVVNRHYNQAYFGVSPQEARNSVNPAYAAGGGIKDLHAGVRWNWALSPSWLLTSGLQLSHLNGSASRSPLVERVNTFSVSTALAYRF